jgi:SAM-dependent methyltransferase
LGTSPISNAFIKPENAEKAELIYTLHVYVCSNCFLVQLPAHTSATDNFHDDYVYFSSTSSSWMEHAKTYCEAMVPRLQLGPESLVIEVASNDGYLLRNFVAMGIPVLGVEPTANTAEVAEREHGVPSLVRFFGRELATELRNEGRAADLLLGNNVLAHVPDIDDFVAGLAIALKQSGTITMEFPHLLRLIEGVQFDTIYHEHYSYLSLSIVDRIFTHHGLRIVDVEEIATHGGSLRIFAQHAGHAGETARSAVEAVLAEEAAKGLLRLETYDAFAERTREAKRQLLEFLIEAKRQNRRIVGYGAAAKGNTLLNYCGIRTDFIDFVVDKALSKQGRLLPGTRIPVRAPDALFEARPDYVLILPWNIKNEIMEQLAGIREWGGRFVVPIPTVDVLP